MNKRKLRLLYCIGSLVNPGGTEKVLSNKANYFSDNLGYDVHIILNNQNSKPYCYEFSNNITFHDMKSSQYAPKTIIKGLSFCLMIMKLRKAYENKINEIAPDLIIVCERGFDDYVLPYISKSIPKIREFHFSKGAVSNNNKIMKPFKKRLFYRLNYFILFHLFNKYNSLVLLTNKDKEEGKYKTNTIVIPNMIEHKIYDMTAKLDSKNVISVGSMHDDRKCFTKQIFIWNKIIKKHPDWILNIYGDGVHRTVYQQLINKLKLNDNIILHGTSDNMSQKYLSSSFFIFTSTAEGLPMVLLEAQQYGLPCIAYDCPTGPSDIIEDSVNGFLVKENDENTFIEKINCLIENCELRKLMSEKAVQNSVYFTAENIIPKWVSFFETMIDAENLTE